MLKTGMLQVNRFKNGEGCSIYRGSYMSAHVLLNLTNWEKVIKGEAPGEACRAFYHIFTRNVINSIKQEHEC